MPDVLTPAQRHRCMSHIRSKATKPEILVRKWLWAHGYCYRLNVKSVSETASPNAYPPMPLFGAGKQRSETKQRVLEKMLDYFDRFYDIYEFE